MAAYHSDLTGNGNKMSYPRIPPEEAIGERDAEIKVHHTQDLHLHVEQLAQRVCTVADVQEVVH